jgi:iron complex outermembrane receptor protein
MNRLVRYLKYSLFFLSLLFYSQAFSQTASISGKVTDDKSEPLTGSVIELRNAADSSLAKVNVADANGLFSFENVKAGKYFIKTSLVGFASHKGEVFTYDGTSSREFPVIKMSSTSVNLKEANVTAIKPLIEVRSDKTVFNVENSINSTGNTAFELLQKAPGVVVDNNDNIMLKGRGGVLVQIDGKDTHFTQEELADYLKSIQSTDVEAIELISNPSSKYEASGTAGIINIRLKKNKNYGTNGSVTAGYSYGTHSKFSKYNTSVSLNNRSKKMNVFANYSNSWGKSLSEFFLYREQNPYIFDASTQFIRSGLNHNYKTGVDYTINKKNTVGIMVNGNYGDPTGSNSSRNVIHNFTTETTDSILTSDATMKIHRNNINFNVNHHFSDTLGHDLMTDFDFGYYNGSRNAFQPNVYTLGEGSTILSQRYYRTVTPTTIHIYTMKSDYSQNFLKGKLGAGYKVSLVNTDNTFNFYNIEANVETLDGIRSNHFVYDENVYAAYLNYQQTVKKFDFQAGLRMENTQSEGDLKSAADTVNDKNVKRNYVDFFPSGGITFNANKTNSFGLIYSRRIDRPDYQELNPFEFKLDELSFRKGNPFLNPQYSDKIELSHTYKYTTTSSVGYSHTRDFFAQITDTISGGKSYITSQNLATENILSLDISSSMQPTKWYGIYFHLGLYNQHYIADFGDNKTINSSVTNFNVYAQNTFKLPYDFTFELSGWYNSAGVWGGAYVTEPQGSLDLGLQKKLFSEQATLKLSYSDVFLTAPWDSHNVYAGIVIRAHGNWESQQFRASLTWRFGNRQMKGLRQRTSGSESEQKRIGGGE